jgi:site-specific DNA recombinase
LHNPFYTGQVSYKGQLLPGAHKALVSQELFDTVQAMLKKNSGRSETLQSRPERDYLLKGIIRCAYCGMPMWSQTYRNGQRYYREHKGSRSHADCEGAGGSIPCRVADDQIGRIVGAIELRPKWLEEILAIVSLQDEVQRVKEERGKAEEKLRRMAKAYVDNLFPDEEYRRQKKLLEMELESLVVPQANAAEEAGKLIQDLPKLWTGANLEERQKLLLTMLDAVYVDAKQEKRIVAIKPKPPFRPIFQVAATKEGSGVMLLNEPPENTPEARACFWWRRGRVEVPLKRDLILILLSNSFGRVALPAMVVAA